MLWLKRRRRRQLAEKHFPAEWLRILERNIGYYRLLPEEDRQELQRHILVFIAEKLFEGCGGLEITDEIKVTIAAQACILLLHRKTDYYPSLRSVLVYPQAYLARQATYLGGGVTVEGLHVRLGESWRRGSVVLSWDDVQKGASDIHDGQNVVFHEFAHQLDSSGGKGDGSAVLQSRSRYIAWARVLRRDYERLRGKAIRNLPTLLNKYGASNPAEFFAVATECFFERPTELREQHAELYAKLREFYHQDPADVFQNSRNNTRRTRDGNEGCET
jgi:hypothetical protein